MDFKLARPRRLALGLTLRAVFVAVLAFTVVHLLASTHFYATMVLLVGIAAVVTFDIVQMIGRAERTTANEEARLADLGIAVQRQRQLEYLQTLLDTVAAALFVVNADGRVVLANRAARSLAGASVDRLEEIAALGASGAAQLLALPPGARQVVSLSEGRRVFVHVSQFSVPGQSPQRLISLQRIAGDLDAVELNAWQDMADVLTHEMMNSLTPISSLSESLETLLHAPGGAQTSELAGALEAIKRRSRGLMDFVGRYRAVAELPAPRVEVVHVQTFCRGIDRLFGLVLKEKGIVYRSSVTPADLTCAADPQMLEQAVINLLRNAADAVTGAEQPQIEISCESRDGRVALAIADNGCGIPDARREQIFVPFFTTKTGGSGIGLNLARQVALAHGGQLEVRANSPRGSVFTLTLPARP